jgi:hypothetical protein
MNITRRTVAVAGAALILLTGSGIAYAATTASTATCTANPAITAGATAQSFDVHCSVPNATTTSTVTQTVTQTVTAPVTTTAPATTTTAPVTTTTTTTPPPTTTTTAAPVTAITHGRQVNATNTGIARAGLTRSQLTASGSINATTPGQVITGKNITGTVTITADNVTLKNSWVQNSGTGAVLIDVLGNNFTMENVTATPGAGNAAYMCVWVEGGTGHKIFGSNLSRCENLIRHNDSGAVTIDQNYLHESAALGAGHKDSIEVYAGDNVQITRNRIEHPSYTETAAINVAPWSGSSHVDGLNVTDNYIDGGHMHFVLGVLSSGYIRDIKIKRNDFGGHTTQAVGGYYWAINVYSGVAGHVQTDAEQTTARTKVVFPDSGADANYWVNCADISPNRSGTIATWTVGAR